MRVTDTKYAWVQSRVRWLQVGVVGATGTDSQGEERCKAKKQILLPTFDVAYFEMLSRVKCSQLI